MARPRIIRCETARRAREPHELRRARGYYRGAVRLCRGEAFALGFFDGRERPLRLCKRCFDRELERGAMWSVELLQLRAAHRRELRQERSIEGSYANGLRGPPTRDRAPIRRLPCSASFRGSVVPPALALAA